jgi:hypothetical protein
VTIFFAKQLGMERFECSAGLHGGTGHAGYC